MSPKWLSVGLLCLAGVAHAESITVTTAEDEDGNNPSACSLREAVNYINNHFPATDNSGCRVENPTSTISLTKNTTYRLDKEISIQAAMTIQLDSASLIDVNDTQGKAHPIIKAIGNHRLFKIEDKSKPDAETGLNSNINVTLNALQLEGCGTAVCADQGGLIYNDESLTLSQIRLRNATARQGGAVFSTENGRVEANNIEFTANQAADGAAIYYTVPNGRLQRAFLQGNTATQADGALLRVAENRLQIDRSNASTNLLITNATLVENNAMALAVKANVTLNNLTVVNNRNGILINDDLALSQQDSDSTAKAIVTTRLGNSIIAGNSGFDCQFVNGGTANNLVYQSGCDQAVNSTRIGRTGLTQLIADANQDGECDAADQNGLLCPPAQGPDDYLKSMRPRLLISYTQIEDSPIVNRGLANSQDTSLACELTDQRGRTRTLCDIGAFELIVPNSRQNNGEPVVQGQSKAISLLPELGDGDLFPASGCSALYPELSVPTGGWQDGCIRFNKQPEQGRVTFNPGTNQLVYQANPAFHGYDDIVYYATTTTSRFSQADNSRAIEVRTRMIVEPAVGMQDKKVNLKGGAFTPWVLLGLLGLTYLRRRQG